MKAMNDIIHFLSDYVRFAVPFGDVTEYDVRFAAKLLIDEKVFGGKADMRAEALRRHSIIVPEWLFEKE